MRKQTALIFLCLTMLGMLAQVAPFRAHPFPDASQIAAVTLPPHSPPGYTATDYAKADAFHQAFLWGNLINTATTVFALCALLFSGLPERCGAVSEPKIRAWLVRAGFLAATYVALTVVDMPLRYGCFQHYKAFGLSSLALPAWIKVCLLGLIVPLMLFVLKYLFVTCTLPLCQRHWWWAAALGIFLIGSVIPELVPRDHPLDLVEKVQPLQSGPHYEAIHVVLRQTDFDPPILVADESRRSQEANIFLAGRRGHEYVQVTDNFLQLYTPQQVALALAHELGHFQRRTTSLLVRKSFGLLVLLLSFGLAFLWSRRRALPVSLAPRQAVIIMLCSISVSFAFAPLSLAFSRAEERLADRHALQLTGQKEEFHRLLIKLAQHELIPLDLPRWQYYLGANHPTTLERITHGGEK